LQGNWGSLKNVNKPKAYFVISQWNNNIDWVKEYTEDYVVFDKSDTLDENDDHVIKMENLGYNIHDYLYFIVCYYHNLPNTMAFLEGNPWDHIRKETFDQLIYNTFFTPLEDYSHIPESYAHKKDIDGGYLERNDPWYLHLNDDRFSHKYFDTFDEFMEMFFCDYQHIDWVRFSPGAQYIVPKENVLYYSREFWIKLMYLVNYSKLPMEAFLIERAFYSIFSCKYTERTP